MNFPLRIADQLQPHLRALRKRRGLTQAQLGALVGVKQARIAEIEAHPGAVSLDQLTKLLAALGGTLHLHAEEHAEEHAEDEVDPTAQVVQAKAATKQPQRPQTPKAPPAKTTRAAKRAAKTQPPAPGSRGVTIPAKKGVW